MKQSLASLSVSVLVACGGGVAGDPVDASVGADSSTGVDASGLVDGSPGATDCSIATGVAGVVSVLHDPDGSVRSAIVTDANGIAAWAECPSGALVSYAKQTVNDGWRGVTVAGVQPGDHLEVMREGADVVTTAKVSVPSDGAAITMVRAWAGSSCAANTAEGATASIPITAGCVGDDGATLPVLAIGKIGSATVYSHSTGAAIVAGGDTTISDMTSWMTGPQVGLSATNVGASQMFFTVQPMLNGRPYGGLSQLSNTVANAASENLSLPPSAFTTVRRVGVQTSGLARRGITRTTDQLGASFDMAVLLPEVTGVMVDSTDAARPTFTVGGALTSTDLGLVYSTWTNNNVEVSWYLVYPSATTASITFPALPSALAGATPTAAVAKLAATIDITGSSYAEILTRGYHTGEFVNYCAALPVGSECWFSSLTIP